MSKSIISVFLVSLLILVGTMSAGCQTTSSVSGLSEVSGLPPVADQSTRLLSPTVAKAAKTTPAANSGKAKTESLMERLSGISQEVDQQVQQATFDGPTDQSELSLPFETSNETNDAGFVSPSAVITSVQPVVDQSIDAMELTGQYPIDFPTVLQLAGADNYAVKIARQQVCEAYANYELARAERLPTLNAGLGFNHHEGQIQATEGEVINVSRSSLFLGGGAKVANSPLNGGSGGPPRLFVDYSIADAIYKPLAAARLVNAQQAEQASVLNDTLLKAGLAYFELSRAQATVEIAQENLLGARQLQRLTEAFVEGGKGTAADTARMNVVVNQRRQEIADARTEVQVASARLATVLQLDTSKLDPRQGLYVTDAAFLGSLSGQSQSVLPLSLIDFHQDVNELVFQATRTRQEIAAAKARVRSSCAQLQAEAARPFLPNLYVGHSGGLFGGGPGSDLPRLDGRSDLDVVVTWELKNLGLGNKAIQKASRSRHQQNILSSRQVRDEVAEQVITTWQRANQFNDRLPLLADNVVQSETALEKNTAAIKSLNGLPLESLQSLQSVAESRVAQLNAIIDLNQWQLRLLRATGQSLNSIAASSCVVCAPTSFEVGSVLESEGDSKSILEKSEPVSVVAEVPARFGLLKQR